MNCEKDDHEFKIISKELYAYEGDNTMMKRKVKCEDCDRKAMEYYLLLRRNEID